MATAAIPRTLPASWYINQKLYALERRAVFQRSWFFLGTVTKFMGGEDHKFEIAQLQLTAKNIAKSEVNVSVKVYVDTTGEELQSHQTRTRLIFTTITPFAPSFKEFFPGLEELLDGYEFSRMPLRRQLDYMGKYNWKTLIDGFQECLHCQYTHPAFSKLYPTASYHVVNHQNWSRHFSDPDRPDDGLFLYFFPGCTLNLYNGGMSSFRVCPSPEAGVSRMEFDYYHDKSGDQFEEYYRFVRKVANEDFELCERAQANLERGVYTRGCLNPIKESGVVYYQQQVFEMVMAEHIRDKVRNGRTRAKNLQ